MVDYPAREIGMVHSKVCFKCNAKKSLTEFYKHKEMADGHLNKCKECTKNDAYNMRHSKETREKILNYDLARAKLPERAKKSRAIVKRWRNEDARRQKCHSAVAYALRTGRLFSKPCIICGANKSVAHHEDYEKPLDVVWYCQSHHKQRHFEMKNEKCGEGIAT